MFHDSEFVRGQEAGRVGVDLEVRLDLEQHFVAVLEADTPAVILDAERDRFDESEPRPLHGLLDGLQEMVDLVGRRPGEEMAGVRGDDPLHVDRRVGRSRW